MPVPPVRPKQDQPAPIDGSCMNDLFTALGLVLVIEGVLYALAPGAMKRTLQQMLNISDSQLRQGGLIAMGIGFVIVWVLRN